MNRRQFIKACGFGVATMALPVGVVAAAKSKKGGGDGPVMGWREMMGVLMYAPGFVGSRAKSDIRLMGNQHVFVCDKTVIVEGRLTFGIFGPGDYLRREASCVCFFVTPSPQFGEYLKRQPLYPAGNFPSLRIYSFPGLNMPGRQIDLHNCIIQWDLDSQCMIIGAAGAEVVT